FGERHERTRASRPAGAASQGSKAVPGAVLYRWPVGQRGRDENAGRDQPRQWTNARHGSRHGRRRDAARDRRRGARVAGAPRAARGNGPGARVARKAGPALAAGCTVVLRPAGRTPYSALAMAELGERAGIPKGVFNVITGNSRAIGGELCANPAVRKLSFTGSTETGRTLMKQSADTIKKLSLELGGNAPFIVFDDADLDAAVEGSIASKYRNAGQTCVCANRIYVQDSVYDAFAARLAEKVKGFKVGPGTEPGVVIGPLIDQQGLEKVEKHVADALGKGARAIVGGKRHERGGLCCQPTVLANVTPGMLVSREETFGPVAPLIRFRTEDAVIRVA